MGYIKLGFNILILLFSSIIGFAFGDIYSKRARNLLDLKYCIRVLESEIINGIIPLPEALENVSLKGRGSIALVFKEIRDDLVTNQREDIYQSFILHKDVLKGRYGLSDKDIEVFLFLGKILGKTDKRDQEKNMGFIISQIDNHYMEAKAESEKHTKLYRSLGVLVGLGLIIILI